MEVSGLVLTRVIFDGNVKQCIFIFAGVRVEPVVDVLLTFLLSLRGWTPCLARRLLWAFRQSSAKSSSSEEDSDSLEEEDLRALWKIDVFPEVADFGNPLARENYVLECIIFTTGKDLLI